MPLPTVEYIGWIEGRPAAVEHDLGSSDLRGEATRAAGTLVPERLSGVEDSGVPLVESVADAYGVTPESVLVTPGASLANAVAALTALDAAEERLVDGEDGATSGVDHLAGVPDGFDPAGSVLVEKPTYEPLVDTPQLFGARIDRFLRRRGNDWLLDPDRVEAALRPNTALVTVTNRHNPTGRLSTRGRLADVAAAVRAVDARLLVDEVYAPYVVDDGGAERAFGGVTAAGLEGTVVTGSLTKFHGFGDLGVGWLAADPAFVQRAERVARHFPSVPGPSRALGRRTFAVREFLERESGELLARNAALLGEFVDRREDLSGPVYEGTSYALLSHEDADGDTVAEAALDHDLLVVPGRFFETPERFRVSLGRDTEHVREALAVLGGVLDDLRV